MLECSYTLYSIPLILFLSVSLLAEAKSANRQVSIAYSARTNFAAFANVPRSTKYVIKKLSLASRQRLIFRDSRIYVQYHILLSVTSISNEPADVSTPELGGE